MVALSSEALVALCCLEVVKLGTSISTVGLPGRVILPAGSAADQPSVRVFRKVLVVSFVAILVALGRLFFWCTDRAHVGLPAMLSFIADLALAASTVAIIAVDARGGALTRELVGTP